MEAYLCCLSWHITGASQAHSYYNFGQLLIIQPLVACILTITSLKGVKQNSKGCRFSECTEVPVSCQERYAGIETTLSN
jgi:hypothetical protein